MKTKGKNCTKCKKHLPFTDFYKSSAIKSNGYKWDGRKSRCKSCISKINYDNYRLKHENVIENYHAKSPIPLKVRRKKVRQKHVDTLSDSYIKHRIFSNLLMDHDCRITYDDIPQELIDSTRKKIELYRELYK